MILNFILVAVTLSTITNVALAAVNARASEAARAEIKRSGLYGVPLGCVLPMFGLSIVGLWTWYGIVNDWRFVAIAWIPFVGTLISRLATKVSAS